LALTGLRVTCWLLHVTQWAVCWK